jgi:hypothetical protein
MLFQQGDVLIHNNNAKLPKGAKPLNKDPRGIVLAEGEATGHFHCIEDTEHAQLYTLDEILYLVVEEEEVTIKHQEHKSFTIPPGIYKVGGVQEYDYLTQEKRRVLD